MAALAARMTERRCGDCRLCCKLPSIWETLTLPDGTVQEFKKPEGQWCTHAGPGGCGIYHDARKPIGCRVFSCIWLQGYGPDEARPDRAHAVVSLEEFDGVSQFTIYEARRGAARRPEITQLLVDAHQRKRGARAVRAWMAVHPDPQELRFRYWLGTRKTDLIARSDPSLLPDTPNDGDRERRRLEKILPAEIVAGPHIPHAVLEAAIYEGLRAGLTYEEAGED